MRGDSKSGPLPVCSAFIVLVLAAVSFVPVRSAACGLEGQRACCPATGEGAACASGLTEVNGCENCLCGGDNPLNLSATSSCIQTTHCGAVAERACCDGELIDGHTCAAALAPVSGCSADCTCGGPTNLLR